MSTKSKVFLIAFSTIIVFYAVIGGILSHAMPYDGKDNKYVQIKIFDAVLGHVVRDYVDEPDLEKVRVGALRGLAEGLDPYSAYLTPQEADDYKSGVKPKGETGMNVSKLIGYGYVVSVAKGSLAETAGVKAGDFIEYANKKASRDISLYDLMQEINGQPGSEVELSIVRQGKPLKIKVKRGAVTEPATESRMEAGNTGYIHVTSIAAGKADEVKAKLAALRSGGAKRYVLDLRGSAFGDLAEATKVANLFISSGTLAKEIGHNNEEKQVYAATAANAVAPDVPLVVIIDHTTAGAAEAIASAVIENKRGEVVGEKSFGAGSRQDLFPLREGGAMLITTVRFASASNKAFMDGGITPTDEMKRDDLAADVATPDGASGDGTAGGADTTNQPQTKAPDLKLTPKTKTDQPQDDKMLKRAIELLNGATKVPAKKAA